jgi:hypothetical protein
MKRLFLSLALLLPAISMAQADQFIVIRQDGVNPVLEPAVITELPVGFTYIAKVGMDRQPGALPDPRRWMGQMLVFLKAPDTVTPMLSISVGGAPVSPGALASKVGTVVDVQPNAQPDFLPLQLTVLLADGTSATVLGQAHRVEGVARLSFAAALDQGYIGKQFILNDRWWHTDSVVTKVESAPFLQRVTVTGVTVTGDVRLSFRVNLRDASGHTGYLLAADDDFNGNPMPVARPLSSLLLTSDQVASLALTPEIARNIEQSQVTAGMTKSQVMLALGMPWWVDSSHSQDTWHYANKRNLYFAQDVLVGSTSTPRM